MAVLAYAWNRKSVVFIANDLLLYVREKVLQEVDDHNGTS